MGTKACPDCKYPVSSAANRCPHCGKNFTRWYVWVIGGVVLLVLLITLIEVMVGHRL